MDVPGLDLEAWNRWLTYRQAIKKPYKEISLHAAAMKLSGFGPNQAAVVERSVANGWQGLFELEQKKIDPTAPKTRTKEQQAAADANFEYMQRQSAKAWGMEVCKPLGKLHLAEALLARYDILDDGSTVWSEKREWLREQVAGLLRLADAAAVLQDLTAKRLVLRLFSDAGLRRLEQRTREMRAAA